VYLGRTNLVYANRYMEGLVLEHAIGATAGHATVTPGSCRDSDNTTNIALATRTTVDALTTHDAGTGLPLLNSIDEIGLDNLVSGSITCSQTLTTITATGNVIPHYKPKDITGTISATGTALTGSGTRFMRDLYPGDLVGSSTTFGFAYVKSVESDTAATLLIAFPGGNPAGIAAQVIHHATVWPGTTTSNKQVVQSINSAGTSIVVDISTTVAGGSPLTIGVFPDDNNPDDDSQYQWVYVFAIDDGTTPGLLISTQHQEPLALPSGYDKFRRVGALMWPDPEDAPGSLSNAQYVDGSAQSRYCAMTGASVISPVVGPQETWYPGSEELQTRGQYPRTASRVTFVARLTNLSTAADLNLIINSRFGGAVNSVGSLMAEAQRKEAAQVAHNESTTTIDVTLDEGGGFKTTLSLSSGTGVCSLRRVGYYDVL